MFALSILPFWGRVQFGTFGANWGIGERGAMPHGVRLFLGSRWFYLWSPNRMLAPGAETRIGSWYVAIRTRPARGSRHHWSDGHSRPRVDNSRKNPGAGGSAGKVQGPNGNPVQRARSV